MNWPFFRSRKNGAELTAARATKPPEDMPDAGLSGSAWECQLQRAMTPREAESVLESAYGGDLGAQRQLLNSMLDTWAMLATAKRTVEQAVIAAPFEVMPWRDGEADVTPQAAERRDLVAEAFQGMRPDPLRGELDRDGLLRLCAAGELAGHQVIEVLWERRLWRGRMVILPRAVKRVGTQHYGYQGSGLVLRFRPNTGTAWGDFPADKFLVHLAPVHEGHPVQAGRWRVLAKFWSGAMYGWEWMLGYTNRFGTPFRMATYKKGQENVKAQLVAMLGALGHAGYGAFPEGVKLELQQATHGSGDLPQATLMKLADQAAELVMLGEVQSSGRDGRTGLSNGEQQGNVRRDALQGYCNATVTTLNQLARMVLSQNYGSQDWCPWFAAEIPEPEDAKANAERDKTLTEAGVPITLEQLQSRHDLTAPADGDVVLMGGQLIKWNAAAIGQPSAQNVTPAGRETDKKGKPLTAAFTPAPPSLEEAMERLITAALIAGVDDFKTEAAEAAARETNEETA